MNDMRTRCHFSSIFENLWRFWAIIAIMLINQVDTIVDVIKNIGTKDFKEFITSGALWVLIVLVGITLIVFLFQFLRWRKTWVSLEGNLIIIERNTLKKIKNTIAVENISSVNMERNLFERIVGTYRLKLDTNSVTTAKETDVSLVFSLDKAVKLRKAILDRMAEINGVEKEQALAEEILPEMVPCSIETEKQAFHYSPKDMAFHCIFSMSVFNILFVIGSIAGIIVYVNYFGIDSFVKEALGGMLATLMLVAGAAYNLIRKFIIYYDFTVYRDGDDLHLRYGLIKLKSYTIPINKISALKVEQPLISRIFKRYQAKIVTVGFGDEKGESSNLTMAIPREKLLMQLSRLVPEFTPEDFFDGIESEMAECKIVKAVKSIKWFVMTACICAVVIIYTPLPWYYAVGGAILIVAFIIALYILDYITAGYKIEDENITLVNGHFARIYTFCTFKRIQSVKYTTHPVAKRLGITKGLVQMLNNATEIPYISGETAANIAEKVINA